MTRDELKEMIADYITALETGETPQVCKCEWKELPPTVEGKVRKLRGEVSMECPVHTKEGLLLDFLTTAKLEIHEVKPAGRMIEKGNAPIITQLIKADDRDGQSY